MTKTVAIITARGGSKRIFKKNIKDFFGQPMIKYAIDVAKKAEIFDEIMVSTDSQEIATIAIKCGAKVPFMRSQKTSSDFATTYEALEEVILEYKRLGKNFDYLCCIYPCVPFLKPQTLKQAKKTISENNINGVVPVCPYPTPIERALEVVEGKLKFVDEAFILKRTQDLKKTYFDAGMFYLLNTNKMLEEKQVFMKNLAPIIIDSAECQDIDDEHDWKSAEIKMKILKEIENA